MTVGNKSTLDDLSLMRMGEISLSWIFECGNTENHDKTVGDLLKDFRKKHRIGIDGKNNINIHNESLILMAAYLFFVFPKEIIGKDSSFDYSFVDESKFNVSSWGKKGRGKKTICRRVRNALSHSAVHIDENMQITFEDTDPKDETDFFKCTISFTDFGNFVNKFQSESIQYLLKNRV